MWCKQGFCDTALKRAGGLGGIRCSLQENFVGFIEWGCEPDFEYQYQCDYVLTREDFQGGELGFKGGQMPPPPPLNETLPVSGPAVPNLRPAKLLMKYTL